MASALVTGMQSVGVKGKGMQMLGGILIPLHLAVMRTTPSREGPQTQAETDTGVPAAAPARARCCTPFQESF